jgi:hypothetical protein
MTLSTLFRVFFRGRLAANRARSATPPRPFRPRLEALEAREVPAILTPIQYPTGANSSSEAYGVAVADFNSDGAADIAVVNHFGNSVSILLNKGDGTFGTPLLVSLGFDPAALGVGDFNSDGRPEIVVAGESSSATLVDVLVNPGTKGNWKVGQQLTLALPTGMTSELAGSLAVGDFNGDGRPDVAVTGRAYPMANPLSEAQGYVHVLISTAGGKPGAVNLSSIGSVAVTPILYRVDEIDSSAPTKTWTAVGDFYGDGRQEILSSVVGYYIVGGQPVFTTTALTAVSAAGTIGTPVALGVNYGGLAVADFNHDGKLDFVSGGAIELGNGDGTFGAAGSLPTNVQSVAVGDFNHDGVPDLVVCDGTLGDASVLYLGNGDGTFRNAGNGPQGSYGLAVGDFNRDGWADVVGVSFWTGGSGLWVGLNDKHWS